jgi:hypothetical protein
MKSFYEMMELINKKEAEAKQSQQPQTQQQFARMDYASRVEGGKGLEAQVIAALQEYGWKIQSAGQFADMNQGIDAIVITTRGAKYGLPPKSKIQIKARKSGEEISVECIMPWTVKVADSLKGMTYRDILANKQIWTGRSMKDQSDFYVVLSEDRRTLSIRRSDEIKERSKELAAALISSKKTVVQSDFGRALVTTDQSTQANIRLHGDVSKLMAFLNPNAFNRSNYNFDIALKKPI